MFVRMETSPTESRVINGSREPNAAAFKSEPPVWILVCAFERGELGKGSQSEMEINKGVKDIGTSVPDSEFVEQRQIGRGM